jgi:hypothetical protein
MYAHVENLSSIPVLRFRPDLVPRGDDYDDMVSP